MPKPDPSPNTVDLQAVASAILTGLDPATPMKWRDHVVATLRTAIQPLEADRDAVAQDAREARAAVAELEREVSRLQTFISSEE